MRCEIPVQRFEVGVRALARHEAQLHQLAGRIVDEDQQRAGLATLLEPAMIAAVDLDKLTVARYWNSPQAMPFDQFDLKSYEEKRRAMLAAVKAAGAAEVLEEDVAASAEGRVEIDILEEGWKAYVKQLFASDHLEGHRRVLAVRKQFIGRDWSKNFTRR